MLQRITKGQSADDIAESIISLWSVLIDAYSGKCHYSSPQGLPATDLASFAKILDPRNPVSSWADSEEIAARASIILYDRQSRHGALPWFRTSLTQLRDDMSLHLRNPTHLTQGTIEGLRKRLHDAASAPPLVEPSHTPTTQIPCPPPHAPASTDVGVGAKVVDLRGPWATLLLEDGSKGRLHALEISWWNAWGEARHGLELGQHLRVVYIGKGKGKGGEALYSVRQTQVNPWGREIPAAFYPGRTLTGPLHFRRHLRSGRFLYQMDIPLAGRTKGLRGSLKCLRPIPEALLSKAHEVVVLGLNEAQCVVELALPKGSPLLAPPTLYPNIQGTQPPAVNLPSPTPTIQLSSQRLMVIGTIPPADLLAIIAATSPTALIIPEGSRPPGTFPEGSILEGLRTYVPPISQRTEDRRRFYQRLLEESGLSTTQVAAVMAPGASREDIIASGTLFSQNQGALYYISSSPRALYRHKDAQLILHLGKSTTIRGLLESQGVRVLASSSLEALNPNTQPAQACGLLVSASTTCSELVTGLVRRFSRPKNLDRALFIPESAKDIKAIKALAWTLKERRHFVSALFLKQGRGGAKVGLRLMPQVHLEHLFAQGRWLEIGLAHQVSQHPGIDEVALNVSLDIGPGHGTPGAQRRFEVDILLRSGSELRVVECKSGGWQTQDFHKLSALSQAIAARGFIATTDPRRVQNLQATAKLYGLDLVEAEALAKSPLPLSLPTPEEAAP